ncbi:hypothetical protein CASFOL_003726 [Castilleja foliolosa]|uniref:Uncharacterized protein n=1 Tax=Castilleja foliolosa TaxID=1961234 RepID=A0ABD3EI11_9LAMI
MPKLQRHTPLAGKRKASEPPLATPSKSTTAKPAKISAATTKNEDITKSPSETPYKAKTSNQQKTPFAGQTKDHSQTRFFTGRSSKDLPKKISNT